MVVYQSTRNQKKFIILFINKMNIIKLILHYQLENIGLDIDNCYSFKVFIRSLDLRFSPLGELQCRNKLYRIVGCPKSAIFGDSYPLNVYNCYNNRTKCYCSSADVIKDGRLFSCHWGLNQPKFSLWKYNNTVQVIEYLCLVSFCKRKPYFGRNWNFLPLSNVFLCCKFPQPTRPRFWEVKCWKRKLRT